MDDKKQEGTLTLEQVKRIEALFARQLDAAWAEFWEGFRNRLPSTLDEEITLEWTSSELVNGR